MLLIKNNKKREAVLKNEAGGDEKHLFFLLGLTVICFCKIKWLAIYFVVSGRGIMFVPEDKSNSDCEDETDDSVSRGQGLAVQTEPLNIKFEVFSTRILESDPKQCVVSNYSAWKRTVHKQCHNM